MSGKNFRVVNTERGYSVFEVFYDSRGKPVRRSDQPILQCYADTSCGLSDWLETIQLAFEKPSLDDSEVGEKVTESIADDSKIECHTPTPGKQSARIPAWKYRVIRDAILKIVPAELPGIAAKDLPSLIPDYLTAKQLAELGSVKWHATSVKLNMEVEGELIRVPGVKPQSLIRILK